MSGKVPAGARETRRDYGDARHAALTGQLAARLDELRRETGDQYVYQAPPPESEPVKLLKSLIKQ